MDLENQLRYRHNRSMGVGDNISRNIDRERGRRDESTRRERELFVMYLSNPFSNLGHVEVADGILSIIE